MSQKSQQMSENKKIGKCLGQKMSDHQKSVSGNVPLFLVTIIRKCQDQQMSDSQIISKSLDYQMSLC